MTHSLGLPLQAIAASRWNSFNFLCLIISSQKPKMGHGGLTKSSQTINHCSSCDFWFLHRKGDECYVKNSNWFLQIDEIMVECVEFSFSQSCAIHWCMKSEHRKRHNIGHTDNTFEHDAWTCMFISRNSMILHADYNYIPWSQEKCTKIGLWISCLWIG